MALAFVRNVGNTGAAGATGASNAISITVGAAGAASGDLLVLPAVNGLGVGAITSVTDTGSNAWTLARAAAGLTNIRSEIWACRITTGLVSGNTIVIHTTGSTDTYVAGVDEFSGFTGTGLTSSG